MAQAVIPEDDHPHVAGRAEYRIYFLFLYPLFFIATLIGRVLPLQKKPKGRGFIFRDAADLAHSVIPWVFSGR